MTETESYLHSLDGRVTYQNTDFTFLTAGDMKRFGEGVAKAFPEYKVKVTGGPYRFYDVKYEVYLLSKIIAIDFYSVRPGLQYLETCIEEIKAKIAAKSEKAGIK